jgi:fatty-acid desaturase
MNKEKIFIIIIALIILLIGITGGLISSTHINLKVFHNTIATIFILIVIFGIPIHFQRLIEKSSYNFITWLHFIMFSFLLYISISAIKKWNFNKNHQHFSNNENKFIVKYKNNKYDISDFIPKHPGGSIITNSKNKNLEDVWDSYNVSWHKTNLNVQNKLKEYKI